MEDQLLPTKGNKTYEAISVQMHGEILGVCQNAADLGAISSRAWHLVRGKVEGPRLVKAGARNNAVLVARTCEVKLCTVLGNLDR